MSFVSIASATIHAGDNTGMWDEEDGFFYDVLQLPNGQALRLKVRSMLGLLPLCAVTVFEDEFRKKYPKVAKRFQGFLDARPELKTFIHDPTKTGCGAAGSVRPSPSMPLPDQNASLDDGISNGAQEKCPILRHAAGASDA